MKLDVEVADVTVDARSVDALKVLEATVEGRRDELVEAGLFSRLVDAVEADRINLDMDVAEVTVEARKIEALGALEETAGWCTGRLMEAVDDAELDGSYLDEPETETLRERVLPRPMVDEEEYQRVSSEEALPARTMTFDWMVQVADLTRTSWVSRDDAHSGCLQSTWEAGGRQTLRRSFS